MLILSSVSIDLEFRSVNHTSKYKNSQLKVFKNIIFLGEISNNWPNNFVSFKNDVTDNDQN